MQTQKSRRFIAAALLPETLLLNQVVLDDLRCNEDQKFTALVDM